MTENVCVSGCFDEINVESAESEFISQLLVKFGIQLYLE